MSEESYVFVCLDEDSKSDGVELPTESDGTLFLSVLQSQFKGASGLKYRNPITGGWRAIKIVDGVLRPPDRGWDNSTAYIVVLSTTTTTSSKSSAESGAGGGGGAVNEGQGNEEYGNGNVGYSVNAPSVGYSTESYKRKLEGGEEARASKNPRSCSPDYYPKPSSPPQSTSHPSQRNDDDLIVLGLEWSVTDEELRTYFEKFGEVAHAEVKKDMDTRKSRGFGFVRFSEKEVQTTVFNEKHTIKGRRVDIKYPKQSTMYMPTKLFVGCLPVKPEVTKEELSDYFTQYGHLSDVYIPRPYRGFGFVTFTDPVCAKRVINMPHNLKKSTLNVSFADPKGGPSARHAPPAATQYAYPPAGYDPYHHYNYAQQYATHYSTQQSPASANYTYPATGHHHQSGYQQAYSATGQQHQPQHQPVGNYPRGGPPPPPQVQPESQAPVYQSHYNQPARNYPPPAGGAVQPRPQETRPTDTEGYSYGYGTGSQAGGTSSYGVGHQAPAPTGGPVAGGPAQQQTYDPKSVWHNY